jgi:hypothetical protein
MAGRVFSCALFLAGGLASKQFVSRSRSDAARS